MAKHRKCRVCGAAFVTTTGGRVHCEEHSWHGTGSYQVKQPKKAKPGHPCATCAHGIAEPRAWSGWACRASLARECAPEGEARRKVERAG